MKNTVIVTGATSGIGFAVCEALLGAGYPVIGVGRSLEHCHKAQTAMTKGHPDTKLRFITADLLHQREVLRAAREIERAVSDFGGGIHALINNAGCVRSRYMTTEEGYEQQFALNHLAGFLLTQELLPLIKRDNAAVINTSSTSHKMMQMNWNDLMYQKRYRPLYAYKQTKLCNMLHVYHLRASGVRACGIDPGLVRTEIGNKNTSGIVNAVWNIRMKQGISPEQSAKIYLSLCENGFPGIYYGIGKTGTNKAGAIACELRTNRQINSSNAERLYEVSMKLCGLTNPIKSKKGIENNECTDNRGKWWLRQSNGNGLREARI
ncbi:MAG: SDR family NAD(P)-dependent oxidoreductase [Oscillospiraceae bacterium]|nr:SDR family NAD(P)-dependent oxidoreductase [Oscillospiraceae bacterium]